ncbi:MAG: ATP-NAD kinase family protein [Anaerolineaceae bacterium]|nr:ATP-NAD kinase family protein [Anaerolineaceae bacterium]
MRKKTLGLIVNPIAGIGGRVGLKGSDGLAIQQKARGLGAEPRALQRTIEALKHIVQLDVQVEIITYPGEMGEYAVKACGLDPLIIGTIYPGETTSEDTRQAAYAMAERGVDLILFAGGDGTARDMVVGLEIPVAVLGIPAGVKIHSACYCTNPDSAGKLAAAYLHGEVTTLRDVEVMDLDEDAYRQGIVAPCLYGYLSVPFRRHLLQGRKAPTPLSESASLDAIAQDVIAHMCAGVLYIIGPGTTTRPILSRLSLEKTLLGVDVLLDRQLAALDANEAGLLALLTHHPAKIVVTPIGGQGYVFGRGNQQISPAVIESVGRDNIIVISTVDKINTLHGQPLLVDTGEPELDRMLAGYMKVIIGYNERIVYRLGGW